MTEHLGRSFSILLHFEWFKMLYRSTFSSFTSHLWNAKPKNQPNKKSSEENTFFQITNCIFFSFWPFLLSNLITFLFILNDLKCYRNTTWSFTNHLWTLILADQHTKNFLGDQKLAL
jgi:hypothetical protein